MPLFRRDDDNALALLPKPPAILPNLLRSFFAAAVMGILAWGALWALKAIGVREIGTGRLILCAVPVLVGSKSSPMRTVCCCPRAKKSQKS